MHAIYLPKAERLMGGRANNMSRSKRGGGGGGGGGGGVGGGGGGGGGGGELPGTLLCGKHCTCRPSLASLPGLHPSFCRLQYEKCTEKAWKGFTRDLCRDRHKASSIQDHYRLVQ